RPLQFGPRRRTSEALAGYADQQSARRSGPLAPARGSGQFSIRVWKSYGVSPADGHILERIATNEVHYGIDATVQTQGCGFPDGLSGGVLERLRHPARR